MQSTQPATLEGSPRIGGWQREEFSPALRADLPTETSQPRGQSTASSSSPLTSASLASSTAANYSNGSTRLPTPPPHSGVAATASPPRRQLSPSTGPSASVNLSKCTPASSTRGAAVCTSLSPSTPATPPGPKHFKPRSAQSFSSPSTTAATPSRSPWTPVTMLELQRHRQARLRIRMRKRIEGALAAESYIAEGTGPPRHAAFPRRPYRRQLGRRSPRRPSHAVDR